MHGQNLENVSEVVVGLDYCCKFSEEKKIMQAYYRLESELSFLKSNFVSFCLKAFTYEYKSEISEVSPWNFKFKSSMYSVRLSKNNHSTYESLGRGWIFSTIKTSISVCSWKNLSTN